MSFLDEIIDGDFAAQNQLFVYQRNSRTGHLEVADRDWRHIKEELLRSLAWGGLPQIELVACDEEGGGLLLEHHHEGRDIKLDEAGELLRQLARLWGAPITLLTREDTRGRRIQSDGETVEITEEESRDLERTQPEEQRAG